MECTTNRVGENFFHQLDRNGHATRLDDLDRFAALGIKRLRYPVLWERVAPDGLAKADWRWPDERLARLHELDLPPIVGLVHHGSGPRSTDLLDPGWAEGLAEFAGAVARRYPWLRDFTPVNEPLTTARFSTLYGHWYPHAQDASSWAKALINQCRAVVLAMRAIRREIPQARLIQTEDLGKTFSTPTLHYQADFENERRWLSFDLIGGYLTPQHPMWGYLKCLGVGEDELEWFRANPCPPDVFGVNYYLSSERFLDERVEHYPAHTHGGNGKHTYADVEAVRVRSEGLVGAGCLMTELWERYRQPIALTEVHNGCTREEQMRWLYQLWQEARCLQSQGVTVEALTVWSLLGAWDWDSLVTRDTGHYEPGVFDIRAPQPRPTALVNLTRQLANGERPAHPVLHEPGWWQRPERFIFGFSVQPDGQIFSRLPRFSTLGLLIKPEPRTEIKPGLASSTGARPLLITGATGKLGRALARACYERGLPYRLLTRQTLDITEPAAIERMIETWRPWAILNTAGFGSVNMAEWDRQQCYRINATGPIYLARACTRHGLKLLNFSSNLVFDGGKRKPYLESDPVSPLGHYGRSQAEAESGILKELPSALVIRSSALFSPWDESNFVSTTLRSLAARRPVVASADEVVSPTYLPELTQVSLDLLLDDESGRWHLANEGAVSWTEWAARIGERAGLERASRLIQSAPRLNHRPPYSVLGSERGQLMSSLDAALERYFGEFDWERQAQEKEKNDESFSLPR